MTDLRLNLLMPRLRQLRPGFIALIVPHGSVDNHSGMLFSDIAVRLGMRFERQIIGADEVSGHGYVAVRRISVIDSRFEGYAVVPLDRVGDASDAAVFLRRQIEDVLNPSPQTLVVYNPRGGFFRRAMTGFTASSIDADGCDEDMAADDFSYDDLECNVCSPMPSPYMEPEPEESDDCLDNEKKIWVDRLTSLVLQYVSHFHESPPMHVLEREIRGKLMLGADGLSDIHVSNDMRIYLPGFNEMELLMTPLARTVYLLFLCYPDGIVLKNISDYAYLLGEIYSMVKPGCDERLACQSIAELVDPVGESLQQKLSLTRRAVRRQILDPDMAKRYMISGTRGGVYGIGVDASMIKLPDALTRLR